MPPFKDTLLPDMTTFTDVQSDAVAGAIRNRRTVHTFEPVPAPPEEEILAAIDLARWAPNHHLTEPWRFYLIGPETTRKISRLNADMYGQSRGEQAGAAKYARWLGIPGWVIVTCSRSSDEIRQREDYAACCCALHNVQLYLWTRGIGVKWTTGPVTRTDQFFEIAGIDPEREMLVGLVWYGFAAEVPCVQRKPVRDILHRRP